MKGAQMDVEEESTPIFYDSHNHYQRVLRARPDAPRLPHVKHCPMAVDESDWPEMSGLLERWVMKGTYIQMCSGSPPSGPWLQNLTLSILGNAEMMS